MNSSGLRPLDALGDDGEAVGADLPRRPGKALVWTLCLGVALYIGIFLLAVSQGFVGRPYSDAYDFIAVQLHAQDVHASIAYLWTPHNGHHPVWMRLATAVDIGFFRGRNIVIASSAAVAILLTAALLARGLYSSIANKTLASVAAAASVLCLLLSINAVDAAQPINAVYAFAMPFVVGAILIYEADAPGVLQVVLAAACVFGACLGNNIGLAVLPALILSACRRQGRPQLTGLSVAAVAIAVAMLWSGAGPGARGGAGPSIGQAARYFVTFCGLPWTGGRAPIAGSAVLGAAVFSVAGFLIFRRLREARPLAQAERIAFDLIVFSLASAAMASFGRSNGVDGGLIPVRYALFMAPLHIGVLTLILLRLGRWAAARPGQVLAFTVAALAAVMVQQVLGAVLVVREGARIARTLDDFDRGQRSGIMTSIVYPDLARAAAMDRALKVRGLYQP